MKAAWKRLTALILALAMCLSLCSVQVWAADEGLDGAVGDSSLCAPEEADEEVESEPEEAEAEPEASVTEPEESEAEPEEPEAEPEESEAEAEESEAEPEESVTEAEASVAEPEESVTEAEASEAEPEASKAEAEDSKAPDADETELSPCADSLPNPINGVITLTEDVVLYGTWQIKGTITLDLNGYGLSVLADQDQRIIEIANGGNLTLKDSNPNRVNTIFLKDGKGSIGSYATTGPSAGETVQVKGGFVTGGGFSGVHNEGSFTMLGGTIIGNTAPEYNGTEMDYSGAGVSNVGTFIMRGGTITRNTAKMGGGGVFLDENSSFTMLGGTIAGNYADKDGGGVYSKGSFTLKSGSISGNHATQFCGKVPDCSL